MLPACIHLTPFCKVFILRLITLGMSLYPVQGLIAQTVTPDVVYVPGSSIKIAQLVGDFDNQWQQPTQNLTNTRYNLWGTDLGIPFSHDGKTFLLFGDVPGNDRDPIAYTTDTLPEDGISLTFITNETGTYKPIDIAGISQGAFEVPIEGISIDGNMYVYHITDGMTRLVLAKSQDNGISFQLIQDRVSMQHFINISIVRVNLPNWPEFSDNNGEGLVIFGAGEYRASDVRMAFQPVDSIEWKESMRYFKGLDLMQNPLWSANEAEAVALFNQPCVGEFSVTYNPFIKKWIILYNCDNPRGINFRTADKPWGPWTDAQILFEPWIDGGYCNFIHVDWNFDHCDNVHDPGREIEWGGEYGPYQFEALATGNDNSTTIYYTMSTWNPYTIVLMKSTLTKPTTSVKEDIFSKNHDLKWYPNPFSEEAIVEFDRPGHPIYTLLIYNARGQLYRSISKIENDRFVFRKNDMQEGLYVYQLFDDKQHFLGGGKIIVE